MYGMDGYDSVHVEFKKLFTIEAAAVLQPVVVWIRRKHLRAWGGFAPLRLPYITP